MKKREASSFILAFDDDAGLYFRVPNFIAFWERERERDFIFGRLYEGEGRGSWFRSSDSWRIALNINFSVRADQFGARFHRREIWHLKLQDWNYTWLSWRIKIRLGSLIRHLKEDIHIFESSIRCHDLRKEGWYRVKYSDWYIILK